MIDTINTINLELEIIELKIRIGIHSGQVGRGIIGKNNFVYDLKGA